MKKTNNKGFSLVELIIVIAIMAILIGVLAPQYIKYVERSRVSADKDMVDSITKAVQNAVADDDYYSALNAGDEIKIDNSGVSVHNNLSAPVAEFYGSLGAANTFKSKAFKGKTIRIAIVSGSGSNTLKVAVYDGATGTTAYDPSTIK